MSIITRRNSFYPSFLEDFFDNSWSGQGNLMDTGTKIPAVNIKETEDCFKIDVAAPGMNEDSFEINLEDNKLSISAENKNENEEKDDDGNYTRREFSYSSFKRSFQLPDSINEDEIEADYNQGVLCITIPKKEEAKPKPPRQIKVNKRLDAIHQN